jgi:hypothetical protein
MMAASPSTDETPIVALWEAGNLPIKDGVYFADGRSYAVNLATDGLVVVEEFDLGRWLERDPEWVTTVGITHEATLPDSAGILCVGDGSWGSEGFFGRLDAAHRLVWVCYLEEANPFVAVALDGNSATFVSTAEIRLNVDIDAPLGVA